MNSGHLLDELADLLLGLSEAKRRRLPGMRASRAAAVPTAVLVLRGLLDAAGADELAVSEFGMREGAVLDAAGIAAPTDAQQLRTNGVTELAAASRCATTPVTAAT